MAQPAVIAQTAAQRMAAEEAAEAREGRPLAAAMARVVGDAPAAAVIPPQAELLAAIQVMISESQAATETQLTQLLISAQPALLVAGEAVSPDGMTIGEWSNSRALVTSFKSAKAKVCPVLIGVFPTKLDVSFCFLDARAQSDQDGAPGYIPPLSY